MKIIVVNKKNIKEANNYINNKTCLVAIFSKQCIHCINTLPEWKKLKKFLKTKSTNSCGIIEIYSENLNSIISKELHNKIIGFPSIFAMKNGIVVDTFNGKRTSKELHKFFKKYYLKYCKTKKNKSRKNRTRKI